jgi:hypothetical protein
LSAIINGEVLAITTYKSSIHLVIDQTNVRKLRGSLDGNINPNNEAREVNILDSKDVVIQRFKKRKDKTSNLNTVT